MKRVLTILAVALPTALIQADAWALEHLVVRRAGVESKVDGELVAQGGDGGLAVLAADGVLWRIDPKELVSRQSDDQPLTPLSPEAMAQKMLATLPAGFEAYHTPHYVVLHNTSRVYAKWCGSLLERLHRAFTQYWVHRGFKPVKERFPLVVIIFADRREYFKHARPEVGDAVESILGYYNLDTNRITMADLTGLSTAARGAVGRDAGVELRRVLSQPNTAAIVATIVHEATHQIAYNCGLHARHGDVPLWFSEGIATFFETPDVHSQQGWRTIGQINPARFTRFQQYLARRPADSLSTLLRDDKRIRDTKNGLDAYAEAWTLTYFLLRRHPKEYVQYLENLGKKRPFVWDSPEERLREFEAVFGDLTKLDREFVQSVRRMR